MAESIPSLSRHTLGRMTAGERRFAPRLEALLEDDYLVWYDIPLGWNRRYPDFIVLHPSRGLLFLEVKDWKPETLKRINKSEVSLLTSNGLVTRPHPLEQVRQYGYTAIDVRSRDPQLRQAEGVYQGNLILPYGWGVVFTRRRTPCCSSTTTPSYSPGDTGGGGRQWRERGVSHAPVPGRGNPLRRQVHQDVAREGGALA